MANKRSDPAPFDLRYDVRLQARFVSEGKLSWDDVQKRALAAPDAAENLLATPAPEGAQAPGRAARPAKAKSSP